MKFTNETLLTHYLEDLTLPDVTHNHKRKAHNPQHWNIPSVISYGDPIKIDPFSGQTIWFWSDIHFNHKNIIQYSNRPFPSVELMERCLIGNYVNVVKDGDVVFWCGDITFGRIGEVNRYLTQMPGYKIHIIGNHDMDRNGSLNHIRMNERHPCYVIDVVDAEFEFQLLITHYPMDNVPDGCVNIHGHIHQHPSPTQHKHRNVCVEHTNYAPLNINDIIAKTKLDMGL